MVHDFHKTRTGEMDDYFRRIVDILEIKRPLKISLVGIGTGKIVDAEESVVNVSGTGCNCH